MCPPEDLHPSSGDGQTDVSGAVPGSDSDPGSLLPSACPSGPSPSPLVDLDFLALDELALDSATASFF